MTHQQFIFGLVPSLIHLPLFVLHLLHIISLQQPLQNMQPAVPLPDSPETVKCNIVGCPKLILPTQECAAEGCKKSLHKSCFERVLLVKHQLEPLVDPANDNQLLVCGKTCYKKVEKAIVKQPGKLPWTRMARMGQLT
jgi:hypothetical protein